MSDITVIVPLHVFTEEDRKLLSEALKTVPEGLGVILSVKEGAEGKTGKLPKNVSVVSSSKGDSFTELVNAAVEHVETKWFSILEYDDTYTDIWLKHMEKHIEFMPDTSIFMCLNDIVDFSTKKYIGFGNEAPWASAFSDEIGHIDLESLNNYFDFYPCGSVFNTDDFKEVGGLKPNLNNVFWYEFLLRAVHNGKDVYVVPKVGYVHHLGREGSMSEKYLKNTSEKEAKYWFSVAKKEYFFKTIRDVKPYSEENGEDEE